MKPYGIVRDRRYPVASWIWGHRLRSGQEWIEYLLEFLNVISGFEYKLGQGITEESKYRRHKRLGLRRFVFYHEREKTTHKHDDLARDRLLASLSEQLESPDEDAVMRLRELFLGLSALEQDRSWYAKSLLPVHENLLMWEALRKGATRRNAAAVDDSMQNEQLDAGIDFTQRNFFARGGELYYLLLSAGTKSDAARRGAIERGLQRLLCDHHHSIGQLAERIEAAWSSEDTSASLGTLHYVPDADCDLYRIIAEDVDALLEVELDVVEQLHLLAHLICFHVIIYIYVHAHPDASSEVLNQVGSMDRLRPTLLIDTLDGADRGVLRKVSATQFKVQEDRIQRRADHFVREKIETWANETSSSGDISEILDSRVFQASEASFSLGSKGSREAAYKHFIKASDLFRHGEIEKAELIERTISIVRDETLKDFRRHFLPVHKKLAKSIGFVSPKKGPNARYTFSDDLMKALTLANVRRVDGAMTFEVFLQRLYNRYGLVFAEGEARESGLYEQQPINVEYYSRNQAALLTKMTRAGLAHEYSDATAMVAPYRA